MKKIALLLNAYLNSNDPSYADFLYDIKYILRVLFIKR